MEGLTPDETVVLLEALLARCTVGNSTETFRSAIEQAIGAIKRGELKSAATIIGETCANVSGRIHECSGHDFGDITTPPCLLQADEDETQAYAVLYEVRFRFGLQTVRQRPNNFAIFRG